MKTVAFKEEAERLNVPVESIERTYRKILNQGKIHGIVDSVNQEFVYYEPRELTGLAERLVSRRVSILELAEDQNLKISQMRLLIEKLLREGRISGFLNAEDDTFIPEEVMKKQIFGVIDSTGKINISELSNELKISKERIRNTIDKISSQIITKIKPYEQISFTDLSIDANLPEHVTIALLKKNI